LFALPDGRGLRVDYSVAVGQAVGYFLNARARKPSKH